MKCKRCGNALQKGVCLKCGLIHSQQTLRSVGVVRVSAYGNGANGENGFHQPQPQPNKPADQPRK